MISECDTRKTWTMSVDICYYDVDYYSYTFVDKLWNICTCFHIMSGGNRL